METKRLILRNYELADAAQLQKQAGDKEIADTTCRIPHPYELKDAHEWILSLKDNLDNEQHFAVTHKKSGELIGAVGFVFNKPHKRAEIGYWIGKEFWGQGYASEVVSAQINYGFSEYDINKITAQVFSRNPASCRVLEKNGFVKEGSFKQHIIIRGKYEDLELYGYLKKRLG